MADQPKKKNASQRVRNDERKNGKAAKRAGSSRNRGVHLTEVQKVLLGKGILDRTKPLQFSATERRSMDG